MQRWRSGRTRTIRNRVMQGCIRGFKSHSLRQQKARSSGLAFLLYCPRKSGKSVNFAASLRLYSSMTCVRTTPIFLKRGYRENDLTFASKRYRIYLRRRGIPTGHFKSVRIEDNFRLSSIFCTKKSLQHNAAGTTQ